MIPFQCMTSKDNVMSSLQMVEICSCIAPPTVSAHGQFARPIYTVVGIQSVRYGVVKMEQERRSEPRTSGGSHTRNFLFRQSVGKPLLQSC